MVFGVRTLLARPLMARPNKRLHRGRETGFWGRSPLMILQKHLTWNWLCDPRAR